MYTKERELRALKNGLKAWLVAGLCLLLLGVLLLVAACSNNYQNPGSPGGTPQATPTGGGYSMVHHVDQEMSVLLVPYR